MMAFALMILMLIAPGALWYVGDKSWGLVALYVALCVPSMVMITWDSIKHRHWPKIFGGPSIQFGRRRWGGK